MNKFHILYRYNNELVSSSKVVEAKNIYVAISTFEVENRLENGASYSEGDDGTLDMTNHNGMVPDIIAIHTQGLVDLMASSRG